MAAKKKTKKKQERSRKPFARRARPTKKSSSKKAIPKKKSQKKAPQRTAVKAKSAAKKAKSGKSLSSSRKQRGTDQLEESTVILREAPRGNSSNLSGDLQGLSNAERADSESVDELLEEGNAFEAGIVSGVEDADNSDGREVHTHEVPEDDVPEEYLDNE
jgi:hypothetical protein